MKRPEKLYPSKEEFFMVHKNFNFIFFELGCSLPKTISVIQKHAEHSSGILFNFISFISVSSFLC